MDISGNSCRLRSNGASGSPHPTNCAPINHANSRANNIRPHCICFIYCFEQNKTNPSVYASRIRLPYRGAKIDSATNPNLSIRFMYAQRYINWTFSAAISSTEKVFPPPIIARASTTQTTVIVIFRLRLLLSIKNCLNVLFSFFSIKQLTFNSIRHIVSLFASKSYTNPTNLLFLYFWLFTQNVQNIKRTDLRFYCTAARSIRARI